MNAGDVYAGGHAAAHIYDGEYIPAIMARVYDYMTWGNNDAGITDGLVRTYLLSAVGAAEGLESLAANVTAQSDFDMAAYAAEFEPTIGAADFAALYPDVVSLKEDGTLDWSALDLSAYDLKTGDDVLPDTATVTTANGTVIGFFGETTQAGPGGEEAFSVVKADLGTIATAKACVEELKADGADVIVGICHTGWFSPDSTQVSSNDTNSAQMALNVPELDAIVDGHTHSIISEGEGWLFDNTDAKTFVNQASCWGGAIGLMELYIKDGKCIAKDGKNLSPEEFRAEITPDPEVQSCVDACYARLDADGYTAVLAETPVFLNAERLSTNDPGGAVRANETNLGDLVADGMIWAGKQLREDISIAIYPGVRVRSSIEAGPVTMLDVLGVFSSPLKIYYKSFTAPELVAQLTSCLHKVGQEDAMFCQVAGLSLVYDSYNSVQSLTVNGEPVYEDGVYKVVAKNYVAQIGTDGIQIEIRRTQTQILKEDLVEGIVVVLAGVYKDLIEVHITFLDDGRQTDDLRPGADNGHKLDFVGHGCSFSFSGDVPKMLRRGSDSRLCAVFIPAGNTYPAYPD